VADETYLDLREDRRHLRAVDTPPDGLPPVPAAPEGSVLSAGDELAPDGTVLVGSVVTRGEPVEGHLIERRKGRRDVFARLDGQDPVIPSWFTDAQVRREIHRRWLRRAGRALVLGLVNSPWLGILLVGWTFRGAGRTTKRLTRWAADRDGHPVSGAQPATTDKLYDQASWAHAARVGFRVRLLGFLALVALVVAVVLAWLAPWVLLLLAAAAVGLLARAGRPETVKTLTPFARKFIVPTITCALVVRALQEVVPSATAKLIVEHERELWGSGFIPIPGGHKVQVVLPGSYQARSLIPHEDRLASGVGRPEDCFIVEPLPKVTAGHAWLYIFDAPVFSGRSAAGPTATAKKTNWWAPMPCGITRTRETHRERLFGGAWFIGGKPEQGKSELGKGVVAWSILDPIVRVMVFNLKGDPGYSFAKASCHQYVSASPDLDPTVCAKVHAAVRWLLDECARRNAFLTRLYEQGKTDATEVTEELSRRYPDELGPITFVVDEIHRMFALSDYTYAEEFGEDLGKAMKAVRSVAIQLVALTQLAGGDSVPAVVTRASRVRACLRVDESVSFQQVFGQAGPGVFNSLGISAFPTGVAVMASAEGRPVKIKVFHITPKLADIGKRAQRLRADLDLLTGEAAGQAVATGDITDPADLLRHLLPVIPSTSPSGGPEDEGTAWLSELETVLTEREEYRGRADGWLAKELKARRVRTVQVNRRVPVQDRPSGQRNETGVTVQAVRDRLADLLEAAS
jgi:hypothetical protein